MFWRALVAFLALPGVVAFAIPATMLLTSGRATIVHPVGLLPLLAGFIGLLWCVRDFYVAGKGTLAPWDPPRHLVVAGLYRYSRNPMYVSVSLMLLGWAWTFGSLSLLAYALIVMLAFYVRVVFAEEPTLARTFDGQWEQYRNQVRRWL